MNHHTTLPPKFKSQVQLSEFKPGQRFNPRSIPGFSAGNVVSHNRKRLGISVSQNQLFDKLLWWFGKHGFCWHKAKDMARELSRSDSSVAHDLAKLKKVGLIGSELHGNAAEYFAIWNPIYDEPQQSKVCKTEQSSSARKSANVVRGIGARRGKRRQIVVLKKIEYQATKQTTWNHIEDWVAAELEPSGNRSDRFYVDYAYKDWLGNYVDDCMVGTGINHPFDLLHGRQLKRAMMEGYATDSKSFSRKLSDFLKLTRNNRSRTAPGEPTELIGVRYQDSAKQEQAVTNSERIRQQREQRWMRPDRKDRPLQGNA
jgi:hypothetical protein